MAGCRGTEQGSCAPCRRLQRFYRTVPLLGPLRGEVSQRVCRLPRGLPCFYFKDQSFIGSTPHTSFFIRVEMLLRGLHILPTSTANLFEFRHSQVIREGKLWGGDFLGRGDRKAKHQRNLHNPVGFSS